MLKYCSKALLGALLLSAPLVAKPAPSEYKVSDFLLTDELPFKAKLDAFFSRTRANFCEKSLKKAGFSSYHPRQFSRVIVAKHPEFPGLVFKMYLDVQRYHNGKTEKECWRLRCEGAARIRKEIEENGWQDTFKVPQKWIYTLPKHPRPPEGYLPKNTILVQEDMDLLPFEENKKAWGSDLITFETLDRLYHILKTVGLNDCTKIPNIPIAKDGRIAFIDTQGINCKDIPWEDLDPMLNEVNRAYWKALTR